MMKYRFKKNIAHSSGLVPMADMLSNTVGIMLFIMAFTVLQTGGVLIPKRLPVEKKTDEIPIYYVCKDNRLIPLDQSLTDKLTEGLGKPTYDTVKDWVAKFNSVKVEDDYFTIIPHGEAKFNRGAFESSAKLDLTAEFQLKDNVGDSISTFNQEGSLFKENLSAITPKEHFIYFLVYPNSIDLFRQAREYAEVNFSIGSGWGPVSSDKPILFNISGSGGIKPSPQ